MATYLITLLAGRVVALINGTEQKRNEDYYKLAPAVNNGTIVAPLSVTKLPVFLFDHDPYPISNTKLDEDLCSCCNQSKSETSSNIGFWERDLLRLEIAAQKGCPRCSLIKDLISLFAPDSFRECNKIEVFNNFVISVDICSGTREKNKTYLLEIFRLSDSFETPVGNIITRVLPPSSTASEQTILAIKGWIHECQTNHNKCVPRASFSPSRILDLRFGCIKLREDLREEYSYACLSHCWGTGSSVAKTTTTTFDQFKNSIPWDLLTKTFQDAIDVCRRLSIDFLWIDSLCIKQDDPRDWKKEAMRMADIYENAIVTLAGTKSNDGSGGLYTKVDEEFSAFHLASQDLYIRQRPPLFPKNWTETEELDSLPLLKRGWIYQERRLSRRMVHFCQQEVVWECKTGRRSESGCDDEDFETGRLERNMFFEKKLGSKRDPLLMKQWHETVSEYSALKLTFNKDKLAALSGIAQRMEVLRTNDRYVAGLWEKTLLHDLEWSPNFGTRSNLEGRSLSFSAPTWSWASIKTSVTWVTLNAGRPEAEVVEVSCPTSYIGHDYSNSDSSLYPCLTLRGRLISAKLTRSVRSYFPTRTYSREVKTADILNWGIEFHPKHSTLRDLYSRIRVLPDYSFHEHGPYRLEPDIEVFILPFIVRYWKGRQTALLLRQRKEIPFFERIGLVILSQKDASTEQPTIIYESGMTNEWVSEEVNSYMCGVSETIINII